MKYCYHLLKHIIADGQPWQTGKVAENIEIDLLQKNQNSDLKSLFV